MCSISMSELPSEILEQILLSLPPTEILKMREVGRLFLDLVSTSQYLQHRIDLFSAGLVDNPDTLCDLAERRARLRKYIDGWKDTESSVRYDCHLKNQVSGLNLFPGGQSLFSAYYLQDSAAVTFIRLPLSPGRETVKEWTLKFPLEFDSYLASPQDNLLAIVELGLNILNIRLLNLLDGSPHELPSQKVIQLDLEHYYRLRVMNRHISSSRIALIIEALNHMTSRLRRELIVWNWETGGVVLRCTSDDAGIGSVISFITNVCRLEGPWLLALCHGGPTPQLLILNTLLPQQDRGSWRILGLPQFSDIYGFYSVISQYERSLEELPEFLVDPTQRVLVLTSQENEALVIPVEPLIQRIHSVRDSLDIPWDEWAEDVITVHLHPDTHSLQLFDMKVLALCCSLFYGGGWGVRMYDLSKSGREDVRVQQVDEEIDRKHRRVLSTPKWFARCQEGYGVPYETRLVGNKVIRLYDRKLSTCRASSLDVWELGRK